MSKDYLFRPPLPCSGCGLKIENANDAHAIGGKVFCVECTAKVFPPIGFQGERGLKHDTEKPVISYLHKDFLFGTAQVMTYGQRKYGEWNHRKGIEHRRLVDACQRHLIAYLAGEDIDPESGLPHIYHATASLNMLCANVAEHPELDDRYKP